MYSDTFSKPLLPNLHLNLIYEHFPVTIDGLLNFTEPKSINASDEGVYLSQSIYSDMEHVEIGQFV
jgi:hypothetical protein